VSIFNNYEVLQHSWNFHCTSTKNYENFLREWIAWLARWKAHINTSVWNKTISCGSGFPANPIFLALFFSRCGWVVCFFGCFAYFLLFALWCNLMPKILSVAHSYCSLTCSDVGTMPTDHSNCWPMASQKYLKKIFLWTYLSYFFSGYKTWTVYFL
jgi:hypothetical protein